MTVGAFIAMGLLLTSLCFGLAWLAGRALGKEDW